MPVLTLLISIVLLFSGLFAWSVPRSSVALGAGGSGVASIEPGESSFMNPATLVHLKNRHLFSTLQKDLTAISITENSPTTAFPGALTYWKDTREQEESQVFGLSFSDYIYERISFGLILNYWQVELPPTFEKRRSSAFNATAGLAWSLNTHFGVGASFENVVDRAEKFQDVESMGPRSRIGLNYLYQEWLRARFDFVTNRDNDWERMTPHWGFETYAGKFVVIRFGWNKPHGLRESWSAGFGLDLPRFRVDYASIWNEEGSKETRHSIDFGVPF